MEQIEFPGALTIFLKKLSFGFLQKYLILLVLDCETEILRLKKGFLKQ